MATVLYVVFALATCVSAFDGAFIGDDFIWLYDAAMVRTPADLFGVHDVPFAHYDGVRLNPTTNLFFAAGWPLFSMDPRGYHVMAFVLYVLTGCLVRVWLLEVGLGEAAALLGGALFLAHPLHAEPVTWLSSVGEILVGLCTVAALWGFVRWRRSEGLLWCALSMLALFCGVLAKESALVIPIVLLLADLLVVRDGFKLRRHLLPFAIALVAAGWKHAVLESVRTDIGIHPLALSLRDIVAACYSYLAGCVVGFDGVRTTGEGLPLAGTIMTGFLLLTAALLRRGYTRIGFHAAWMLIAVQPYVWWVPLHALYDRYAYQPSLALTCVAACFFDALPMHRRGRAAMCLVAIIGVVALGTVLRGKMRAIHLRDDTVALRDSLLQALRGTTSDETVYVYNLPSQENATGRTVVLMGGVEESQVRDWYDALSLPSVSPRDRFVFYDEATRRYIDLTDSVRIDHEALRGRLPPATRARDQAQSISYDFNVSQQRWPDLKSPVLDLSPFAVFRVEVVYRGPDPPTLLWQSGNSGGCAPRSLNARPDGALVAWYDPGAASEWWTGGRIHTLSLRADPQPDVVRVRIYTFGGLR